MTPFRAHLQAHLAHVLEWYTRGDVTVCDETIAAIQRDVDWCLREAVKKFGLRDIPGRLLVRRGVTGFVDVQYFPLDPS